METTFREKGSRDSKQIQNAAIRAAVNPQTADCSIGFFRMTVVCIEDLSYRLKKRASSALQARVA